MSTKTKEQLIAEYRRANKKARPGILKRQGFSTEQDYFAFLMAPDPVNDDKPTIHNIHIVDISGSMAGAKLRSAVQGVNTEVDELKKDTAVNFTHSLIEFSDSYDIKTICWKTPIADVKPYVTTDRGSTALNQAIGETLERLVKEIKPFEKVLVKIFTDGGENASLGKWARREDLREFIKECQDKHGFTITFIGTKYDVDTVVNTLNIHVSNTLTHDNTSQGVYLASMERGIATKSYASKVLRKEDVSKGFYKDIKKK
jgi:uncharacterized protein YegL